MTQVAEDEDAALAVPAARHDRDGVVRADVLASAAIGTLLLVDRRHGDAGSLLRLDLRLEEQVGVRLLDVAIEELNVGEG